MGTTIDRANELLVNIEASAYAAEVVLPERIYSIVGTPQPTCDSVITAVTNLLPLNDMDKCPPQQTTLFGVIAREFMCWDNEGNDIPEKIEEASLQMARDGDVLWYAAWAMLHGATAVSVGFSTAESLWIATVQLTVMVL